MYQYSLNIEQTDLRPAHEVKVLTELPPTEASKKEMLAWIIQKEQEFTQKRGQI